MSRFVITPQARLDIDEIWEYIALDSVKYADLVETAIINTCRMATENSNLGHRGQM